MALFNVPGLSDFVAPRRNALLGFASGLARGPDLGQGLAYGFQGAAQGQQADNAWALQQEEAAERQRQIEEANALKTKYAEFFTQQGRTDIAQGIADGIVEPGAAYMDFIKPKDAANAPASVQEYQFYANQALEAGEKPLPYNEWRQGSNQTVRAGLGQPIPLRNKSTGETVPFMPMSDGTYVNPLTQERADNTWEFDPAYISAQKAQGGALGKAVGTAQFDLPAAELSMNQSLDAIEAIRSEEKGMEEQFGNILGVPQQLTPAYPGSDKAKFQVAVDRGVNRAFLEAREVLRGGGQITDFESRKAETAITNMQIAMEKGDKAQFQKALDDFEQAVKDGYTKLKSQAGALPSIGGASAPAGSNYVYNPATGKLEPQ